MRHQSEPDTGPTTLLLQKPKPYAELDENSRIAISILGDDGWKVSRVGLDMRVLVTATPMIEEVDAAQLANAKLVQHLADAELKFVELRKKFERSRATPWFFALMAMTATATLYAAGHPNWILLPAAVCFAMFGWRRGFAA